VGPRWAKLKGSKADDVRALMGPTNGSDEWSLGLDEDFETTSIDGFLE